MALAYLLALQAVISEPAPPSAMVPSDFDLAALQRANLDHAIMGRPRACTPRDASEIVVCGTRRSGGSYPLAEMARVFEPGLLVAAARIGDATARAYMESVEVGPGFISNRIMVGVKLPF